MTWYIFHTNSHSSGSSEKDPKFFSLERRLPVRVEEPLRLLEVGLLDSSLSKVRLLFVPAEGALTREERRLAMVFALVFAASACAGAGACFSSPAEGAAGAASSPGFPAPATRMSRRLGERLDRLPSVALLAPDVGLVRDATLAVKLDDLRRGEGPDVLGVVAQVEPLLDGVPVGRHYDLWLTKNKAKHGATGAADFGDFFVVGKWSENGCMDIQMNVLVEYTSSLLL